jgi:hypothetical protein
LGGYVQGSGSAGQVAYWSSTSAITGESNLFWDGTNDRLGIGTDSPSFNLDIVGSVNLASGNSYRIDQGRFVLWNGNAFLGDIDNLGGDLYIRERGNNVITVSNGNVGIGTNSPSYLLTVGQAGTTADSYIQIASTTTGTGNLFFGDATGTGSASFAGFIQYQHNVNAMVFGTASNTRLTISSTGAATFLSSVTAASGINAIGQEKAFSWQRTAGTESDVYSLNANSSRAYLQNDTTSNTLMVWQEGGNVGIGTDSPGAQLDISTTVSATGAILRLSNQSNSILADQPHGTIQFFSGDNSSPADSVVSSIISAQETTSPNQAYLSFLTGNNTEKMRITSGGNVGIGTDSPKSRLQVSGSVALPHVTKSANYTLDNTDYTVGFDCASNRTATLPDATTCAGRIYVIYQYNTNLGIRYVTLDGNGSQTINGLTTVNLQYYGDFSSVMIQSNGSNWVVISDALYFIPV